MISISILLNRADASGNATNGVTGVSLNFGTMALLIWASPLTNIWVDALLDVAWCQQVLCSMDTVLWEGVKGFEHSTSKCRRYKRTSNTSWCVTENCRILHCQRGSLECERRWGIHLENIWVRLLGCCHSSEIDIGGESDRRALACIWDKMSQEHYPHPSHA